MKSFLKWILVCSAVASVLFGQASTELAEHAKRAQEAIAANNPTVAKQELRALLQLDPKNAAAYANLGMLDFVGADYEQAAQQFQQALKLDPSSANAQAFLGMCDLRQGKNAEGRQLIENTISGITDRHLHVQAGLELVKSYSEANMVEKAAAVIADLLRSDPDNPEILYASYRVYSSLASANLQKLAQAYPDSSWLHEVLGQNYMAQERYSQAAEEFRKALAKGPQLNGLHYQLGEALMSEERNEEKRKLAEEQFVAELARDPGHAQSLCKLAEIEVDRANLDKAQQFVDRCLASSPSFAEGHAMLASLAERRGDLNQAIREFETAERLAPDVKATHYRLSMLFKKAGRDSDAQREIALYRKLAAIDRVAMTPFQ